MKIHGTNKTTFNPYLNNIQKQAEYKKDTAKIDQLQISKQAKQLQETDKGNPERIQYVQDIKKAVESGDFKVNHEETAKRMFAFWMGQ